MTCSKCRTWREKTYCTYLGRRICDLCVTEAIAHAARIAFMERWRAVNRRSWDSGPTWGSL